MIPGDGPSWWYGLDHLPITIEQAEDLLRRPAARRVAYTEFGRTAFDPTSPIIVSTVFLVLDHSFQSGEHIPVLYETLVMGGPEDGWMERAAFREQAERNHANIVRALRARAPRLTKYQR